MTATYSWNSRNQLTSIASPGFAASFQYDSFGRRTGRTVQGVLTNYVYDGLNPVQEKAGVTVTANLLTGLGIDEFFTRTDGVGSRAILADALGSTVALGDNTGTLQTQYTYEPFGYATQTGLASASSYKYTGREDDGTGLVYYRARYYHPRLQRFISEDPIGFRAGSINLYGYVGGNPMSFVDHRGLTQADIDNMGGLARNSFPDLKVPDSIGTMDMWGTGRGFTNPFSWNRGIYVHSMYLKELDCDQLFELFELIIHESIHRSRSRWDSIWRPIEHDDIYAIAAALALFEKAKMEAGYCKKC